MQKKNYLDFSLPQPPLPKKLEQQRLSPLEIASILDGAYCVRSVENVGMEFLGESPIKRIIEAQLQKIAQNDKKVKIFNKKIKKIVKREQEIDNAQV